MNTKEICKQLSVTPKMLRVYENQKLIHPVRGENNYRKYSIEDILQIQIIVLLRDLGFSLNKIRAILDFKKSKNDYLYSFYIQLKAVETKINELNNTKKRLNSTINQILSTEEKGVELIDAIFSCCKNDNEKVMYEEILNRWNFDKMAVDYVNRYLKEDLAYQNSIKKVESMLLEMPTDRSFLDVGGGTCYLWANLQKVSHLTVIDKSLQMIFEAKEKVTWAQYILDDILLLQAEKYDTYDVVISTFTLHHIPYELQQRAINNMIGLCKKGGTVIIVDRGFINQSEMTLKVRQLAEEGNIELLDIIKSEFYLIVDTMEAYFQSRGYQFKSFGLEEQVWGFIIKL
jgi:putative AdoMet-dependent methyltransferase